MFWEWMEWQCLGNEQMFEYMLRRIDPKRANWKSVDLALTHYFDF